jgi:histone-lysine N-methyltransferase SETD3
MFDEEQMTKKQKLSNAFPTLNLDIDEDIEQKEELLKRYCLHRSYEITNGIISNELMSAVRICLMTDIELYFFDPYVEHPKNLISPYNEMRSLLFLKRKLSELMKNTDSTETLSTLEMAYRDVIDRYIAFVSQYEKKHSIRSSNENDDEKLKNFMEWSNKNYIRFNKVAVVDYEVSGKGIIAAEDISSDEIVIAIPRKLLLCEKTALESEVLGEIFTKLKEEMGLDESSIVTLFIMYEKANPNSKWKPYFDILPSTLPTYPLYFSDSALEKLNGTTLYLEIMEIKDTLRQFQDSVFPILFEHFPNVFSREAFTYDNLVWARAIADTRAFSFKDMGCCLLPFVDFVNTSPYPQLESKGLYINELDEFQIKAFANVKKGEQLFICYGPYSNRELLLCYGFMTENNEYDRFYLDFSPPEEDDEQLVQDKMALLEKFHLPQNHFFRRGKISSKMLAALRVLLMNEKEMEEAKKDAQWNPFLLQDNDSKVIQVIQQTLEAAIEMLNSEMSEESNLAEDERLAVQYKASVRAVLEESLQHAMLLL